MWIRRLWRGSDGKVSTSIDEASNLNSVNRGFKTINQAVVTYEQTKKGLSLLFYPIWEIECNGIHPKPLNW